MKLVGLTLFFLLASISLVSIVNAQTFDFYAMQENAVRVIDSFLGIASPFFEYLIGEYHTSEYFFTKILLLVLLVIICKFVLDKTPLGEGKNKKISLLISVIISVLAVRFMSEAEFIEAILVQYGVLGIAITSILPLVIFFYFIHNTKIGTYGRKVFWAIYIIIFVVIWLSRPADQIPSAAHWIYGLTLVTAGIFLFFDKNIHSYFGIKELKAFKREQDKELLKHYKRQLSQAKDDLQHNIITQNDYEGIEKKLQENIKKLYR